MKQTYIAKTFFGLEEVLAEELKAIGAENIEKINRAVSFEADELTLFKANMGLRTALRILHPLAVEKVRDQDDLYALAREINWMRWFTNDQTYAVRARVAKAPAFKTPLFVALKTKDAIADQFRHFTGARPNIDKENPDIEIHVHIFKERCTISIDSSGESLHRRGYRKGGHAAPLNEVLAAGMVALSGWDMQSPLVDFMCGSGTILTEAALAALNRGPNVDRKRFGFMNWKNFDRVNYSEARMQLMAEERSFEHKIYGSDTNRRAIKEAIENARNAELTDYLDISNYDFRDYPVPEGEGTVIINPPYGERLRPEAIERLYKSIGDVLKQNYAGYTAWMISSNMDAVKKVGLRPSKRIVLYNGALECRFLKYEMYKGRKEEG
jgi:putative N6-adenine-specific DNA methylase